METTRPKTYEEKKECLDSFLTKLEDGNFDDSLIQHLDVRDAILYELTTKDKWQLVLRSEPLMQDDSPEFKTFFALGIILTQKHFTDVPKTMAVRKGWAMKLIEEAMTEYSLASVVHSAVALDAIEHLQFALSRLDTEYLLNLPR